MHRLSHRHQTHPLLTVNPIDDKPAQLGGVLNLVLRLAEDYAQHASRLAQVLKRATILHFEGVTVLLEQFGPA